ncbi:MAG TPA: ABC transporter permease [Gemmatimonadaceae bacterium]|nr:ABC transporter permease [Gemmatimonadaceae bacterium]
MSLIRRLINFSRSDRHSRDLDRELAFHLDERVDELVAAGMPREAAVHEARRMFGNYGMQKERARDVDVVGWLDSLRDDVRYAIRSLRHAPGLAVVAIVSLALGIGANTAIFSLVDAILLRSLPVSHPEALVRVEFANGGDVFTNPLWEQIRNRQRVFDGAFAYGEEDFDLTDGGLARHAPGAYVSGAFFSTLGLRPAVGRLLSNADDVRGCAPVAVVSYGYWQSGFGGRADVVGRTISLNRHPVPIVGVIAGAFGGVDVGRANDVYVPLCAKPVIGDFPGVLDLRANWWLYVMGRVKPQLSLAQARAGLASIAPATFSATLPENWPAQVQARYLKRSFNVAPAAGGISDLRLSYQRALYVLMAIVGLVLLIACANVANLLLARATARQREVAVRVALGASRSRIARQLLTESVLLSLAGAVVGLVFAQWGTRLLVAMMSSPDAPIALDLGADARVLAFTIAAAVVTGIAFGTMPAWRAARVPPSAVLKSGGRGLTGVRGHFAASKALVVAQIAVSLALVVGAGLLVGTFRRLATTNLGFRTDDVLVVTASPPAADVKGAARASAFQAQVLESMRAIPGVRSASISRIVPLSGTGWNDVMYIDGYTAQSDADSLSFFNAVSDEYFQTLGTPMLAGRAFGPAERAGMPPAAIVNEAFAKKFFHATNAVGHTIRYGFGTPGDPATIVGVAADAKYSSVRKAAPPTVYLSIAQDTDFWGDVHAELRVAGPPAAVEPSVVAALARISPHASVKFTTLSSELSDVLRRERALAVVSGFFGALALLLAMLGLYGVMAYAVARRRAEIGIRMALGAGQRRVAGMVVREVTVLLVAGLLIGLGFAAASTRLISSFLYGLKPMDSATLAGSVALLAIVALGAAYLPARRAARVDPMDALREE